MGSVRFRLERDVSSVAVVVYEDWPGRPGAGSKASNGSCTPTMSRVVVLERGPSQPEMRARYTDEPHIILHVRLSDWHV